MPPLTQSKAEYNGIRGHVTEYGGVAIRVYDDADTAFRVIALFEDEGVHEALKARLLFGLLFPNPQGVIDAIEEGVIEDPTGLIEHCVGELCGLDVSTSRSPEKNVIDFVQDEPYIRASLWGAYGASLDDIARKVTYKEFIQLLALAPFETPMGQAIYYRTAKPPKRTKYNADEIKDFNKRKRFWAIREGSRESASGDQGMTDAFAALRKACNG